MSKSRAPIFLGLTAAGGIGYYLYNAGGDTKVAEKRFESDLHKASAEVKQRLPGGRDPDAEKGFGDAGARTGAKIDSLASETDKQLSAAKSQAESYAKEAKANTLQAVNDVDRKIEEGAAKAKGWFSGGK